MVKRFLKAITCLALTTVIIFQTSNPVAALPLSSSFATTQLYATPHLAFIVPFVTKLLAKWVTEAFGTNVARLAATEAAEVVGTNAAKSAATEVAEVVGTNAAKSAAIKGAETATVKAAAGTAGGLELALAGSIRIDAAVLRNAMKTGGSLMFAGMTAHDIYDVYTAYKEAKVYSGKFLNPCTPITIHLNGSDKSFTVYDDEMCSLNH
jgi:hypothetical protein